MKYPYMTFPDETEITHSDIRIVNGVENITVYVERPIDGGFANAFCTLPSYEWSDVTGFSTDDIALFEDIIRKGSHLIYKFARQGGFQCPHPRGSITGNRGTKFILGTGKPYPALHFTTFRGRLCRELPCSPV
ncbi:MAG: hypothetical protein MSL09_09700 [Spirochaetia bacterium]|nr:hypothetical protein [Spirochaetia bacterium]